jgi:hypothetical protein
MEVICSSEISADETEYNAARKCVGKVQQEVYFDLVKHPYPAVNQSVDP